MIGKTISHYKILEKLGEGGMGVVYKAEDTKLERTVALKFLSPNALGTDEERIRFVREAKAAAALAHPNICTIYEIDEAENQAFIAFEYIDGQSLDERIESGPLNADEALDVAIQISEGLRRAHRRGIVHRDIKSANIMIDEDGQAKILDFGLAKLTGKTRLTKTATIMGTVSYMSPEQAHGEAAIDHHTDIWSLGVLMYEMLAGRLPFDAPSDAGLIHKIIYEQPEPLSGVRGDVPAALEQAIKKALQKDPQDRYADMAALVSDLKSIRSGAAPTIVVEEKTTPSIAVLPFADMSPQKDQEYFCDGMTQLSDLKVIARTSAFSFKGQNLDVREIGKKLNVGTVLEGSIQKAGDRVRITAQLVNTTRGEHLWSEKYDRDMEDIFAIQDEISEAIVEKLKPTLLGEEKTKLSRREIVDLEAYDLYLRGRYFLEKNSEKALRKAIECFEQAIEKAPDYALAYVGLAEVYSIVPIFSPSSPAKEAYSKAREAALKALEIDDKLAEAHYRLGLINMYYDWDWEGVEKAFKQELELNPGSAEVYHFYAIHLRNMRRFDEGIEMIRRALELDPLSLGINREAASSFYFAGRHDQAIKQLQKTIEMDPTFPYVHLVFGFVYLQKGMHAEAMAEFEKEKNVLGRSHPAAEMAIGIVHALMGRREEAEKTLELFKKTRVAPFMVATLYFALGDKDHGFEWMDKAIEERDVWLRYLSASPALDLLNVRSDPRYKALLIKMGLEKSDATVPMIEQSPSIAVLPFVNMSADPDQEYFCDGLAEELINALTQIEDLRVIARTSAFSFKDKNVNVREIGRDLNVETILEGSVRKAGNRLRITAQLVTVAQGHHLWSERYDREMEDVFAIQDDITQAIVEKLKPRLLKKEKAKIVTRQTVDIEAYNLYLKGCWFLGKRTEEGLNKAFKYFNQAIVKAPTYAPAYAGVADFHALRTVITFSPPKEAFSKARDAAMKALEIDDKLAEAHISLGQVKSNYEWDWEGAEREYKQGIELNPGLAMGHAYYALCLMRMARFDEAFEQMEYARNLDPLSLTINYLAGMIFFYANREDDAIEVLSSTIEMDRSVIFAHGHRGLCYFRKAMFDEAFAEFEKEKVVSGTFSPFADGCVGIAQAIMGNMEEAQKVLSDLQGRSADIHTQTLFIIALLYLAMGKNDQGFELLEKGYEERTAGLSFLKIQPLFDIFNLRSDPRYISLLKRMNLDK